MMFMPYFFFFMFSLFMGLFISLSSMNWLYIWMGLEINLISFIPLMMSSQNSFETESGLKYFLSQAFGSGLLLFGLFMYMMSSYSLVYMNLGTYIMVFSMMIKIGMFPFHFWLPHVMGGCNWMICMMISVVQKIAPMFVLYNILSFYNMYLGILAGLGSLIGGLGGLNQSQLRFILAYSSIGHMGWMMVSSMFSYNLFLIYFMVYSLINLSIMFILNFYSMQTLNMMTMNGISIFFFLVLGFMFMSLAGLPPFLGFYPKMMVLNLSIGLGSYFMIMLLLIGSLMNIFYYLSIFFNLYLFSSYSGHNLLVLHDYNMFIYLSVFLSLFSSLSLGIFYLFIFYAVVLFYKS